MCLNKPMAPTVNDIEEKKTNEKALSHVLPQCQEAYSCYTFKSLLGHFVLKNLTISIFNIITCKDQNGTYMRSMQFHCKCHHCITLTIPSLRNGRRILTLSRVLYTYPKHVTSIVQTKYRVIMAVQRLEKS